MHIWHTGDFFFLLHSCTFKKKKKEKEGSICRTMKFLFIIGTVLPEVRSCNPLKAVTTNAEGVCFVPSLTQWVLIGLLHRAVCQALCSALGWGWGHYLGGALTAGPGTYLGFGYIQWLCIGRTLDGQTWDYSRPLDSKATCLVVIQTWPSPS